MRIGFGGTKEPEIKLITNRRQIAAGLSALVAGGGVVSVRKIAQLSNVPLTFDPADFNHMMQDGLFLPDYRHPMARIVFEDGKASAWHRWINSKDSTRYKWSHKLAIECCSPDSNGMPRFTQLRIG